MKTLKRRKVRPNAAGVDDVLDLPLEERAKYQDQDVGTDCGRQELVETC
jgi:hypothetical protein